MMKTAIISLNMAFFENHKQQIVEKVDVLETYYFKIDHFFYSNFEITQDKRTYQSAIISAHTYFLKTKYGNVKKMRDIEIEYKIVLSIALDALYRRKISDEAFKKKIRERINTINEKYESIMNTFNIFKTIEIDDVVE